MYHFCCIFFTYQVGLPCQLLSFAMSGNTKNKNSYFIYAIVLLQLYRSLESFFCDCRISTEIEHINNIMYASTRDIHQTI